jgi:hypothetical protein
MLTRDSKRDNLFLIRFKSRDAIRGLFIQTSDFEELSRKNLWRIVNESKVAEFTKTGNESLARIFNGSEFTKLELQA